MNKATLSPPPIDGRLFRLGNLVGTEYSIEIGRVRYAGNLIPLECDNADDAREFVASCQEMADAWLNNNRELRLFRAMMADGCDRIEFGEWSLVQLGPSRWTLYRNGRVWPWYEGGTFAEATVYDSWREALAALPEEALPQ